MFALTTEYPYNVKRTVIKLMLECLSKLLLPFPVSFILMLPFFTPSALLSLNAQCSPPRLSHLLIWDRWRSGALSPCHPSQWAAAGWQKWTPSQWVGRSQRCASASGWGSVHQKRSWCPDRGCTSYRCAGSDKEAAEGLVSKWTEDTARYCMHTRRHLESCFIRENAK